MPKARTPAIQKAAIPASSTRSAPIASVATREARTSPRRRSSASAVTPMEGAGPSTLTKSVYEQLRSDLLEGRLAPGEKLRAEALRNRFKVGSSPIREALNRLLAEGFVCLEEQKGFRVAPISVQDLRELLAARIWIDGAAMAASIERYATEWEEGVVLALHRLSRVERGAHSAQNDNTLWNQLHRNFHMALVGGCGSRWMLKTSALLFDAAERYRLYATAFISERDELQEHRQIVDACIDRKPDVAVQLLKQHYGQTCDIISSYMAAGTGQIQS